MFSSLHLTNFRLSNFTSLDRMVRWTPKSSIFEFIAKRKLPKYYSECRGTPRRELNTNLIDGIRIQSTFNPNVKLTKKKRYWLDKYPSRNWEEWNPHKCFVRGGNRVYNIPEDLRPFKDELGKWHPPKLSGRYVADIKKQYLLNGIPWVYDKNFYSPKIHFGDKEPIGPKIWYIKEFREARVRDAMLKMDTLVFNYRKEKREKRSHNWMEKVIQGTAGGELAAEYIPKGR